MNKINFSTSFRENDHGTPAFPFQAFSQVDTCGQYFVPYHWHQDVEFLYVTEGSLILHTETDNCILEAGQIYFINPETLHGLFGKSQHSHHYALTFHLDFLSFSKCDICQTQFLEPLLSGKLLFPDGSNLPESLKPKIAKLIQETATAYISNSFTSTLSIKIALLQILEILFQNNLFLTGSGNPVLKKSEETLSLKSVFTYIEKNYSEKISLEKLASCIHMNKNYFCKYFRENTGKTPFVYLNEYRVNQAASLLLRSELPITEIALATGFDNISYFIRQFKRYKGCTPSQFRKSETLKAIPIL